MSNINIIRGLKFKSKNFTMDAEVVLVNREMDDNILVVKLTPLEGNSWEEDWNLQHTRWGFDSGEYYVVSSPDNNNELECTPGTWKVESSGFGDYRIVSDGVNVASTFQRQPYESQNNAYLLASSKDLYEALKRQHEILIRYYEVYNNVFTKSELADLRSEMYNILNLLQKANPNYKP